MTVPVSYQVIADFAGGVVPEADVLAVSVSRDVGEIFEDIRAAACEVTLDNQQGDYSPGNVAGPFSLEIGGQIRIEATTDQGSLFGLFNGFVDSFTTNAQLGQRQTQVRALDVAQFLSRDINTGLLLDTNTAELVSTIMSDTNLPSSMFAIDNKLVDKHPFAFIDNISAGGAIRKVIESGAHFSAVDGNGVFQVRNRNVDLQAATVASYSNDAFSMRFSIDDRTLMNDIRIRGSLREAGTVTSVAGLLDQTPTVPASGEFSFFLQYQDPDTLETPMAVNSLAAPVASSDWLVSNSGGTDITASMSLTVTAFALSALVELFNGTGDEGFIDRFFLDGIPLRRQPPFRSQAQDAASQAKFQRRHFGIDSDLLESVKFADAYAQFLDFRYATPLGEVSIAQRNRFPDVIEIDLLDTIHIQDSLTAINSTFLIIGVEHAIDFASLGTVHTATYRCRLQQEKAFLILDDSEKGKLDVRETGF